ncbi:hypothetical protein C9I99_26825, partial [Photobacterium lutimaris]
EPDDTKAKRQQRRNSRLLSRNYESRDPIDEPCKKFRTQYAQRPHKGQQNLSGDWLNWAKHQN